MAVLSGRGAARGPSDASHCGFNGLRIRRRLVAGELVSVANGRQPTAYRGHLRTTVRLGRQKHSGFIRSPRRRG